MESAALLTELYSYHELLAVPRPSRTPNDWALLIIAERLTRRALKAVTAPELATFPATVETHYQQLRLKLRETPEGHTHWDERTARVLEAGRLLKQLAG